MDADLDVVVVNWNTRNLLAQCLASLERYPPAVPFTVWVVDNGSTDGSVAMVQERFPNVRLIQNEMNAGFARANNQAIRTGQADWILLLNSDAQVTEDSLDQMVLWMADRPKIGALGPMLVNPDGTFQASFARFPTIASELVLLTGLARLTVGQYAPSPPPRPMEQPQPVDWVAGAALLLRRTAIEQVDLLDEGYFMYSEETDLCWRLRQAGWEVWYLPQAAVMHVGGASSRHLEELKALRLYSSKLRFFGRAYGKRHARVARGVLQLALLMRCLGWLAFGLFSPKARRRLARDFALWRRLPSLEKADTSPAC